MSNDQRPEEIYNALVDTYPDDAVFLGHYGRYLYEQAFSKKSYIMTSYTCWQKI